MQKILSIIESMAHEKNLSVESALDDGTTFHLYFPVDPIHPIDPPAPD